jgi:hypothetical protein
MVGTPVVMREAKSAWSRFILVLTCLLLAVPVLVDVLRAPKTRPFGYVAADTFYYLSVARNIVEHGSPSMDGLHATNGFHPLWQIVTAVVYGVSKLLGGADYCVLGMVLASLACAVAAVWILGRVIERAVGYLPAPFVLLPFGVYALGILPHYALSARDGYAVEGHWYGPNGWSGTPPVYGTLYSFVNGMESSLVILAFAVVAWAMLRADEQPTPRRTAAVGGALAFLCLARLDHGAFAVVPLVLWGFQVVGGGERRRFALASILAFVIPMAVYAGINLAYAGSAFPVSGAYKSTFPLPSVGTVSEALELVRHPLSRHPIWRIFRHAPTVLSMLSSILYLAIFVRVRGERRSLVVELRTFATPFDAFLVKMTPGIWLLGTYDLLFVGANGIGEWYHPIATLYMSLALLGIYVWLSGFLPRLRAVPAVLSPRVLGGARVAGVLAMSALVVAGFVNHQVRADYHAKWVRLFWEVGPRVRETLGGKVPNLFEYDDGIVGFSLRAPTLSGSRLGLDQEAMRASTAGHLVDLAVERGFGAFTTFVYGAHWLTTGGTEADAARWVQQTWPDENLSRYRAQVVYGDDLLTIVQLAKPTN